jgi:hypothetical protein
MTGMTGGVSGGAFLIGLTHPCAILGLNLTGRMAVSRRGGPESRHDDTSKESDQSLQRTTGR